MNHLTEDTSDAPWNSKDEDRESAQDRVLSMPNMDYLDWLNAEINKRLGIKT